MIYKKIIPKPEAIKEKSLYEYLLEEIYPLLESNSNNEELTIRCKLLWEKIEEDLDCLNNRLREVSEAESKFRRFVSKFPNGKDEDYWNIIEDFDPIEKKYGPLHYIQLNYVDKVISFYEKVYTYLSHLSILTSMLAPKEFKDQIGGRGRDKQSNSKFVDSVGNLFRNNLRFQDICNQLLNISNFRSQMVHSLNSQDFIWVTLDYEKNKEKEVGTYLLFIKIKFRHIGEDLSPIVREKIPLGHQHIDPFKSNYIPPFETDEWFVTPNCSDSFDILIEFTRLLFKQIAH